MSAIPDTPPPDRCQLTRSTVWTQVSSCVEPHHHLLTNRCTPPSPDVSERHGSRSITLGEYLRPVSISAANHVNKGQQAQTQGSRGW